jgi:hypothetical protein
MTLNYSPFRRHFGFLFAFSHGRLGALYGFLFDEMTHILL